MNDSLDFCDHCGQPLGETGSRSGAADAAGAVADHEACRTARTLEPPRYCPRCGRRMIVKVTPTGWSSHCSQHGQTTGSRP